MPAPIRTQVFGPAYLDRVLVVDRPLVEAGRPSLDQSVDGSLTFGPGLSLRAPGGATLAVTLPDGWPGPTGQIELDTDLGIVDQLVRGLSWHDDLGGMGAGYAAALGGTLVSALGAEGDPMSQQVSRLLNTAGVIHSPVRVAARPADWTLLLTSGAFGDKLPVGFRGCHAAIDSWEHAVRAAGPCDLRVVAAIPNRLAAEALRDHGVRIRVFAPSSRNMIDREVPVGRFAEWIDVLCCNRREWESLEGREQVAWQVAILAVTDGAAGSVIRFTTPQGEPGRIEVPAFPRTGPPRDTNRAGEAYASTLISFLLAEGWSEGVVESAIVRRAAERASVAAALVLDRDRFGFPTAEEIDAALRVGRVGPGYNAVDDAGSNLRRGGGA